MTQSKDKDLFIPRQMIYQMDDGQIDGLQWINNQRINQPNQMGMGTPEHFEVLEGIDPNDQLVLN